MAVKNNHKSSQWHHIHRTVLESRMLSNTKLINHLGHFHCCPPAVLFCLLLALPWWWAVKTHTHIHAHSLICLSSPFPSIPIWPRSCFHVFPHTKVNSVLQLGPSQPNREFTTQTLTTIYKILHLYRIFIENTFCCYCCAVRFLGCGIIGYLGL